MYLVSRKSTPTLPSIFGNQSFFDSFFDDVFSSTQTNTGPQVKVNTTNESYSIDIAAPGLPKDAVNVVVKGDILTVSSEVNKEDNGNYFCSSFKKSWTLPEDVSVDNINASFNNGVFNVSIPRVQPVEPPIKKIEIK